MCGFRGRTVENFNCDMGIIVFHSRGGGLCKAMIKAPITR
jgi:hypothetical protein